MSFIADAIVYVCLIGFAVLIITAGVVLIEKIWGNHENNRHI